MRNSPPHAYKSSKSLSEVDLNVDVAQRDFKFSVLNCALLQEFWNFVLPWTEKGIVRVLKQEIVTRNNIVEAPLCHIIPIQVQSEVVWGQTYVSFKEQLTNWDR